MILSTVEPGSAYDLFDGVTPCRDVKRPAHVLLFQERKLLLLLCDFDSLQTLVRGSGLDRLRPERMWHQVVL